MGKKHRELYKIPKGKNNHFSIRVKMNKKQGEKKTGLCRLFRRGMVL